MAGQRQMPRKYSLAQKETKSRKYKQWRLEQKKKNSEPQQERRKTVYDDLREKLDVDCLSIDSSHYAPLDRESVTVNRIGRRPFVEDKRREPSTFETPHGFEVSCNRDPSQMLFLTPCADGIAPRGWCRKYWWDVEAPTRSVEGGGRATVYKKKHQELMNQVNEVLGLALKDEGHMMTTPDLVRHRNTPSTATNHSLRLGFKHQIFRDVGICPLAQPYLFSNDNPQYPPTDYSVRRSIVTPRALIATRCVPGDADAIDSDVMGNQDKTERKRMARLLPSHARHRLLDSRLLEELTRQQQLRDDCASAQKEIDKTRQHWEDVDCIWIQRTEGIPYVSDLKLRDN